MSLFYEDEFVELHHGDCRAVRGWTLADVLVTDPPYGVSFQSSWMTGTKRHAKIAGDESVDARDWVLDLWGDRPALVFGTWRAPRPASVRQRLIWAKGDDPGMGDLSMP